MSDIYNGVVDKTWIDASTLATFTSGKDYLIQNQGQSNLQAAVLGSEPDESTRDGTIVLPLMQCHYKPGNDALYLRALVGTCRINISEAD